MFLINYRSLLPPSIAVATFYVDLPSALSSRQRVVCRGKKLINVDSFIKANMAKANPVLSESVVRNHDQLALDVFVCKGLAWLQIC